LAPTLPRTTTLSVVIQIAIETEIQTAPLIADHDSDFDGANSVDQFQRGERQCRGAMTRTDCGTPPTSSTGSKTLSMTQQW